MEKITQEEIDEMNAQANAEIDYDIASYRYQRDNTSDVNLTDFYNTKIEELKARRV
jgi:hypothetical protein